MNSAIQPSPNRANSVGPPEYANEESFRGPYLPMFPRGNQDRQHDR